MFVYANTQAMQHKVSQAVNKMGISYVPMQNGLPGNGRMTQQYLDVLTRVGNRHMSDFPTAKPWAFIWRCDMRYSVHVPELTICSGPNQAVICSLAGPDASDERRERSLKEEKHCLCSVCEAVTESGSF